MTDNADQKMTRRDFLKRFGAATAGGVLTAGGGYAYTRQEVTNLTLEHVTLPLRNLPPALEGFKIAQLSDLHLYPYTPLSLIKEAVALSNSLQPDMVALTGDFVWRNIEAIYDLAPVLAQLNATYGVFASMGNHDVWRRTGQVERGLSEQGLTVLKNQGLTLQVGTALLGVAGLDDALYGRPNLRETLNSIPPNVTTILLAHEPDIAEPIARTGWVDVQLSGHSHGGQIRLPVVGALALPPLARKYDLGLYQIGNQLLYTNRGLGVTTIPHRLNCPPELTLLTLARA